MPELPEVETTIRGIAPYLQNQKIKKVIIRKPFAQKIKNHLKLTQKLADKTIVELKRRGKYILIFLESAQDKKSLLIIHLRMSGFLNIVDKKENLLKHDHFDLELANGDILRYNDKRRFGTIDLLEEKELQCYQNYLEHPLLVHLGVEPLSKDYNTFYLTKICQKSKRKIKNILMDGKIVVGIGNIYASEILFLAKILPFRLGENLTKEEIKSLILASKKILKLAIQYGGTTLRDFSHSKRKLGYFKHKHQVYDRENQSCQVCKNLLLKMKLNGRSTFYCKFCQK